MANQLIFQGKARRYLKAGIDKTAQAVAITLGPKGRNVALDQKWGLPTITHDGVTVAKEIELQNHYQNMGAQLLKEVATKTNDIAGDGTTTATVLAHALVSEGLKNLAAGANPMLLKRGLEKATAAVSAALKEQAIQICTRAEMANVASISAQSREIGELIAEVLDTVGPNGAVTIEEGQGMVIETQYLEGMQFDRGYLSPYFITHAETMETVLEEPYILLCEQRMSAATDLVPLLEKLVRIRNRNLVVIADDISGEALAILVLNKLQGIFNLVAVKAPGFGDQRQAMLQDMATLTGGTLMSQKTGRQLESATLADLGCCDKIVVTKDKTTILGGHGDEAALSATQAAVEEGIVPGGGVALLNAICALDRVITQNPDEATGVNVVRRALEEPLRIMANNAGLEGAVIVAKVRRQQQAEQNNRIGYNVMSEQYEDMVLAGIIDPARVTRGALENAASIAAMILTIEVLVAGNSKG